ncbi:unnamed protein product, partial [Mesorhabditis belari]|uniref:Thyrotropin-releasing hormone receptor n=1 Tax=Mesorhabditis belari TaxID=2138241 RepID=A0AAF3F6J1_9BILA
MNLTIESIPRSPTLHITSPSTSQLSDDYTIETRILMTMIFTSLSIIGVVGNAMVVLVVTTVKGMASTTNCYLVSLAIADSTFFVATLPSELMFLHGDGGWYLFGSIGCSFFTSLPYFALTSSVLSITAFTVERYLGICYPYKQLTWCSVARAKTIIKGIWLFSLLYNAPWIYLATIMNEEDGLKICTFALDRDNWSYKAIYLFDFFSFYAIPMLLNIVIYVKIAIQISRCGTKMKHTMNKSLNNNSSPTKSESSQDFHVSGSARQQKGRNSVVKMLAIVVLVFAVCWLPYKAMVMHNSFSHVGNKWDSEAYIFIAKTLVFINCAINPILYNVMSKKFRGAFAQLLKGRRPTRTYNSPKTGTSFLAPRPASSQDRRPSGDEERSLMGSRERFLDEQPPNSPLTHSATNPARKHSQNGHKNSVRFSPRTQLGSPLVSDGIIVEL